ncbi:beta-lactamase family protein [bacterium]|nr:beta-lactamase family protein [bacterium]
MSTNKILDREMQNVAKEGAFPSAQLLVNKNSKIVHEGYYGIGRETTHYDLSSLTKVLSTTTLAMHLVADGLLKLDETVYDWLAGARQPIHRKITVKHLLNHSSGLPAWQPFYREVPLDMIGTADGKQLMLESCYSEPATYELGLKSVYSDIGFMILGRIVEEAGSAPLDELFTKRIAKPLGLKNTFYVRVLGSPLGSTPKKSGKEKERRFAPTEDCPWREKVVRGEVNDQNAYAFGGIVGHSGLFSTVTDVNIIISELVKSYRGESDFLPQEVVKTFIDFETKFTKEESTWLLGWDTPSPRDSAAGQYFSKKSIGHLGYTGCSISIDLEQDYWVILLSNRTYPMDTNTKIRAFRPKIHDKIYETLIK